MRKRSKRYGERHKCETLRALTYTPTPTHTHKTKRTLINNETESPPVKNLSSYLKISLNQQTGLLPLSGACRRKGGETVASARTAPPRRLVSVVGGRPPAAAPSLVSRSALNRCLSSAPSLHRHPSYRKDMQLPAAQFTLGRRRSVTVQQQNGRRLLF